MKQRYYVAIDLKSFYASVECVELGLDPLTTNLVVADKRRTNKTICLAVSPSLKAYGIPGRPRLFEVEQKVKAINAQRQRKAPGHRLTGSSCFACDRNNPGMALDYVIATPRMALYIDYSARIYNVYLKYVAPEDIHVYSIDEVFIDVTPYLNTYGLTPRELAIKMIQDVLETTGITATAGIGTNLYLSKVAMDIVAKHIPPDKNGVRIAELDEMTYRKTLWSHQPITDFWRIGHGYAKKLADHRLFTMGDIARCSIHNEDLLYKLFGINAELLIDHAWGWESCTIKAIKEYKPKANSMGSGQVLQSPYPYDKAKLIVREMTERLVLDLVEKRLVTDQIVLAVGYDSASLKDVEVRCSYQGAIKTDHYGRYVPQSAHGSINLGKHTSSTKQIVQAVMELYERIVDETLLVRRVNVVANHVIDESSVPEDEGYEQPNLFTDFAAEEAKRKKEEAELVREKNMQKAMIAIQKKYGKNAILKAMDLQEGATAMERNGQIGGHKS